MKEIDAPDELVRSGQDRARRLLAVVELAAVLEDVDALLGLVRAASSSPALVSSPLLGGGAADAEDDDERRAAPPASSRRIRMAAASAGDDEREDEAEERERLGEGDAEEHGGADHAGGLGLAGHGA